ncbi:MAG: hypothetical protein HY909_23935 [Deltaproteobacteria bacterium]|nr:hypothetical protein [Deltaproteobacteria bacterium]
MRAAVLLLVLFLTAPRGASADILPTPTPPTWDDPPPPMPEPPEALKMALVAAFCCLGALALTVRRARRCA